MICVFASFESSFILKLWAVVVSFPLSECISFNYASLTKLHEAFIFRVHNRERAKLARFDDAKEALPDPRQPLNEDCSIHDKIALSSNTCMGIL